MAKIKGEPDRAWSLVGICLWQDSTELNVDTATNLMRPSRLLKKKRKTEKGSGGLSGGNHLDQSTLGNGPELGRTP